MFKKRDETASYAIAAGVGYALGFLTAAVILRKKTSVANIERTKTQIDTSEEDTHPIDVGVID